MKRKLIIGGIIAVVAIILGVTIAGGAMGEKRADKQIELGNKYLEESNYEQAILAYEAVIKIDENNIEAILGLADVYIASGENDKAITILEDGLKGTGSNKFLEKLQNLKEQIHQETLEQEINNAKTEMETVGINTDNNQLLFNLISEVKDETKAIVSIDGEKIVETDGGFIEISILDDISVNKLTTIQVEYYEGENNEPYAQRTLNDFLVYDELNAVIEDIEEAKYFTQVNMSSVDVIEKFKDLMFIDLNGKYGDELSIGGNLQSLSHLEYLMQIDLNYTQIEGDLSQLSNLKKLTRVSLWDMQVTGDINAFDDIENLKVLALYTPQVTGNTRSLSNHGELQSFDFCDMQIEGNLNDLINLNKLKYISFRGGAVEGNLSLLSGMKNLEGIYMPGNKVIGDLSVLSGLELRTLNLNGCEVTGDLSDISEFNQLNHLALSGTKVTGDLSNINKLSKLGYLGLSGTQVTGDLSLLANLNINQMYISGTNCTGTLTLSNGEVVSAQ